jgi:putative transposase
VDGPANASPDDRHDQLLDAFLLPSQPLTAKVLRRPVEFTQYTSGDYATLAADLTVTLSTGRTGQCWDNALAESFFASLKGECLDQRPWPTRAAARRATVEYIAWYNGTRLHSALGYRTPDEFETTTDQEVIKQVA